MRKLHIEFMKDLCNHDFHRLYYLIIELMEDEQIEDVDINTNLDKVKSYQESSFLIIFCKKVLLGIVIFLLSFVLMVMKKIPISFKTPSIS